MSAQIWLESGSPDTDVMVKLVDVYPDGYEALILDAGQRARFRDGDTERDELAVCDRVDPPLEEYAPGHQAACHHQRKVRKGDAG